MSLLSTDSASFSVSTIDRGWAWLVMIAGSISTFIIVGTLKSIGILLTEMVSYFNQPTYIVFMVLTVLGLIYIVTAPLSIILIEVFSVRAVIIGGVAVAFVLTSLSSLAFNIYYVIGTLSLGMAINNGFTYGNTLVIVSQYFEKYRSLANGITLSGSSLGTLVMPLLIQLLLDQYGVPGTLLMISGLNLNLIVIAFIFRPVQWLQLPRMSILHEGDKYDNKSIDSTKNDQLNFISCDVSMVNTIGSDLEISDVDQPQTVVINDNKTEFPVTPSAPDVERGQTDTKIEHISLLQFMRNSKIIILEKLKIMFDFSILRNRIFQLLSLYTFVAFFGYFNFIVFLPAIAKDKNIDSHKRAILVSLTGIADLVSRILTGLFANLDLFPRYYILIVAQLVLFLNTIVFGWVWEYFILAIQCVVYGLASGAYVALWNIIVIDFLSMKKMLKALVFLLLLQGLGTSLGPIILGAMKDATGSFFPCLITMGTCSLLSSVLLFFYPLVKRWEKARCTLIDGEK